MLNLKQHIGRTMIDQNWIKELFSTIDSMDSPAFAKYITQDGTFQWGAFPKMEGTEAITQFVSGFFSMLTSLSHDVTNVWQADGDPDTIFAGGNTLYTIPNGEKVTLSFLNLFRMEGKLIREYTVFCDPTPLNEAFAKQ